DQDAATLALAFAAVTLQPLDLGQGAVEIGAHLLDLVVERPALRGLSAEQGEEAAALATQPLRLLAEAVELGLLLGRCILVALDLVGLGGIDACATVHGGELVFEPQACLVAPARVGGGGCIGSSWSRSTGRSRRHKRKGELRRCRRDA